MTLRMIVAVMIIKTEFVTRCKQWGYAWSSRLFTQSKPLRKKSLQKRSQVRILLKTWIERFVPLIVYRWKEDSVHMWSVWRNMYSLGWKFSPLSSPQGWAISVNREAWYPGSKYRIFLISTDLLLLTSYFQYRVYPTMACKAGWSWTSDSSIGFVIGYKPNKNPLTGLTIELLHGDRCWSNGRYGSYNTTVDMICDMKAGIGDPVYNTTTLWKMRCTYRFSWRSVYACPKCRPEYFKKVYDTCVNGRQNSTYALHVPCWGDVPEIPKDPIEGECRKNSTRVSFVRIRNTVNKVMIGVGVVIIVVLIGIAVFFFCKHRNLRFKYFSMITRNKPMSRLEEEEDEAMGQIEDDFYQSGANAPIVRPWFRSWKETALLSVV